MIVYKDTDVFQESLKRIRWLFDQFKTVVVSFSGGKDSVVVLQLALIVARELDRTPIKLLFLDQEAEYESVITLVDDMMRLPEIDPYWYQVPFKLFNSNSSFSDWLNCWREGDKWMREKSDISIKENTYGTDRFKKLLEKIALKDFGDSVAILSGMRAEESPARRTGITSAEVYGGETWGRVVNSRRQICILHPIYDWAYTDIWKAIHSNKWPYCDIYDKQYALGVSIPQMRVSSLCHEISSANLHTLQEFEKETWEKLVERLSGVHTTGNSKEMLYAPKSLPFMFSSWVEYRDYLAEHLLSGEGREKITKKFEKFDSKYLGNSDYMSTCIATVLNNDHYFTKLEMFVVREAYRQNSKRVADLRGKKGAKHGN